MNNQRVIKFRLWDIKGKKIHYPDLIAISRIGAVRIDIDINFLPGESIIQQFTGLLDKNNKEIYEGDIVSYISGIDTMIDGVGQGIVEFGEGCFGIGKYPLFNCYPGNLEIIGNIFDNPELLKK